MKKILNNKFINTAVIAGLATLALTACGSKSDSAAEQAPVSSAETTVEQTSEAASTTGGRGSQITLADSSTSRSTEAPAAPAATDAPAAPAATEAPAAPAAEAPATEATPTEPAADASGTETGAGSVPVVSIPVIDFGKLPPAVTIPVLNLTPSITNPVVDCFRGGMRVNVEVSTRFSLRSVVVQRANIFGATITTSLGWLGPDTGSGNVWNGVNVGGTSSSITIVATDVNGLTSSVTVATGLFC